MRIRPSWSGAVLAGCLLLAGCNLAPDYKVPETPPVVAFKEDGTWSKGTPQDTLPRSGWWEIYGDQTLSGLESQIESANPTLAQALARYDAAEGYLSKAQSGLFPQVFAGGYTNVNRQGANKSLRIPVGPDYYGDNLVGASFAWDLDLWGRIRNEVAAGKARAQSAFADVAAVRLSLQGQLANDYLELRGLDAQVKLLTDTVAVYDKAFQLINYRHDRGIASGLDVGQAQTQLSSAQAQLADTEARRALFEHAIASLVGTPASNFNIAPAVITLKVPNIPAGLPSTLLQRRPDVASAERLVAATNAGIGVARAAFFPDISITGVGGFQNTSMAPILAFPTSYWGLGPAVTMPLFTGGLLQGQLNVAKAENASAVAAYRGAVLKAFQDVEDNLALLNRLATEANAETQAVNAALRTENLALALYQNGAVNFLDVVVAQTTALEAQRTGIGIQTRRLQAGVGLIGAIGGGWSTADMPDMAANPSGADKVASTETSQKR
jgi:NodT family efflux transporter outer membrane factor (OMF) lipoprotein